MKGIVKTAFYVMIALLPLVANAQSNKLVEHEIQPNETLESIATLYGLSVDELKKLNPDNYKFVYAGFTLKIPSEAKEKADKKEAKQNASKAKPKKKRNILNRNPEPPAVFYEQHQRKNQGRQTNAD